MNQEQREAQQDLSDTRPEYVDFDVNDFPGGLKACLEAILMVADQPQHGDDLARVLAVEPSDVAEALHELTDSYEAAASPHPHGFTLRHTARGWQFVNRREFESVVAAFVTHGQTARLSQAALEALAIIAYKQPMTRAQVASIRGVNSDGVLRSLLIRGLIRENGIDEDTRGALLVTTAYFLEKIGLDSLEQLPALAPFLPNATNALKSEDDQLQ
ncbi:SMC-Scp complex subunit ScpB [Bifidobacterium aquikefiricola]|uniref:SMC-Scp complex subunit ScpB n=1 Tax=Bifidobacterium aquikefiricola TaxID=3059038 RepID=A0AB39U949_9BIFI